MVAGTVQAGALSPPPYTTDADYSAGVGVGNVNGATGGNGEVVIYSC